MQNTGSRYPPAKGEEVSEPNKVVLAMMRITSLTFDGPSDYGTATIVGAVGYLKPLLQEFGKLTFEVENYERSSEGAVPPPVEEQ